MAVFLCPAPCPVRCHVRSLLDGGDDDDDDVAFCRRGIHDTNCLTQRNILPHDAFSFRFIYYIMSFPFHRIAHIIALDQQLNSYAMELIGVYLLLCIVVVVSFFVLPWVDWHQCETLQGCRLYCRCFSRCWSCGCCGRPCCGRRRNESSGDRGVEAIGTGTEAAAAQISAETTSASTQSASASLDHIVISVKPSTDKVDAKLSPSPSYSEFAPPPYEDLANAMVNGDQHAAATMHNAKNASGTSHGLLSTLTASTASRASRAMMAIWGTPKNAAATTNNVNNHHVTTTPTTTTSGGDVVVSIE